MADRDFASPLFPPETASTSSHPTTSTTPDTSSNSSIPATPATPDTPPHQPVLSADAVSSTPDTAAPAAKASASAAPDAAPESQGVASASAPQAAATNAWQTAPQYQGQSYPEQTPLSHAPQGQAAPNAPWPQGTAAPAYNQSNNSYWQTQSAAAAHPSSAATAANAAAMTAAGYSGQGGSFGGGGNGGNGNYGGATAGAGAAKGRSLSTLKENVAMHIMMVALISLLLLIPALFFSWVLDDRKSNEYYAIESMVSAWGGEQTLMDPELIITTVKSQGMEIDGDYGGVRENLKYQKMDVAPLQARSLITINNEKRYRGNYEASLYMLDVVQEARFDLTDTINSLMSRQGVTDVLEDEMLLSFSIADTKGISEVKSIRINNREFVPEPDSDKNGFVVRLNYRQIAAIRNGEDLNALLTPEQQAEQAALYAARVNEQAAHWYDDDDDYDDDVPALSNSFDAEAEAANADSDTVASVNRKLQDANTPDALAGTQAYTASANGDHSAPSLGLGLQEGEQALPGILVVEAHFLVRGSQSLSYKPLAQVSELRLEGSGVVPSFAGDFLPREREVDTTALTFSASYYQNNLSTGHAAFSESTSSYSLYDGFEIGLSDTSESYVLIERLTKYVLLFIAMTFVSVLAFELISQHMVSLVQYVVIGAALILFYMVLLSLSEHVSFTLSYVVAALLMSTMIGLYLKAVFASKRNAICVTALLLAMYAVLFAIVHIEAYALLVGTILLVIMLGIIMFVTRKLNTQSNQL